MSLTMTLLVSSDYKKKKADPEGNCRNAVASLGLLHYRRVFGIFFMIQQGFSWKVLLYSYDCFDFCMLIAGLFFLSYVNANDTMDW